MDSQSERKKPTVRLYNESNDRLLWTPIKPFAEPTLIIADPPFNIGYSYDAHDDRMPADDYKAWCKMWLRGCYETLADVGSIAVVIGDEYAADMKLLLDDAGFTMRNWIVWHYTFGQHCKKKFGRDHTHVLYFVKDPDQFTFNADAVRIESGRQRLGDKRADPKGRVPGDVWSIPRLPGNAKERNGHPCQLPEQLVQRLVLALSNAGDTVLDPFAGSGTTAAVAVKEGRNAVLIEKSEAYCELIKTRLSTLNCEVI